MTCTEHKLVADVAIVAQGRILMVKYRDTRKYDGQTGWFLPDDFLKDLEHPEDASRRIATEQLGLAAPDSRLGFIESFGNGAWHLVFHYRADFERMPSVRKGSNVAEMEWFDLRKLPNPEEVAHHGWGLDVLARIMKGNP